MTLKLEIAFLTLLLPWAYYSVSQAPLDFFFIFLLYKPYFISDLKIFLWAPKIFSSGAHMAPRKFHKVASLKRGRFTIETLYTPLCIVTLTFDLLTSKSIGHILDSWGVCMWSFMMIGVKGKQLCAGNPNAAGQTEGRTDGRTEGHGDSSIPPPNFVAGGYNNIYSRTWDRKIPSEHQCWEIWSGTGCLELLIVCIV